MQHAFRQGLLLGSQMEWKAAAQLYRTKPHMLDDSMHSKPAWQQLQKQHHLCCVLCCAVRCVLCLCAACSRTLLTSCAASASASVRAAAALAAARSAASFLCASIATCSSCLAASRTALLLLLLLRGGYLLWRLLLPRMSCSGLWLECWLPLPVVATSGGVGRCHGEVQPSCKICVA
jgi:hypothetical protein